MKTTSYQRQRCVELVVDLPLLILLKTHTKQSNPTHCECRYCLATIDFLQRVNRVESVMTRLTIETDQWQFDIVHTRHCEFIKYRDIDKISIFM